MQSPRRVEQLVRAACRVYPSALRGSLSDDMAAVSAREYSRIRARRGRWAAMAFVARTLAGIGVEGMGERLGVGRRRRVSTGSAGAEPRRGNVLVTRLGLELRNSVRSLRRSPGFTSAVVLTLALGIGANSLIFGVVNGVLLRPLPYPEPDRLVRVYHIAPGLNMGNLDVATADLGMADATYFYLRDAAVFEDIALYDEFAVNLSGTDAPERSSSSRISHSLFAVLGVPPALGRTFNEADERRGAEPVVILSDGLWWRQFGGRTDIVGELLVIDDVAHEIVGVMPSELRFPRSATALWTPRTLDPTDSKLDRLGISSVARMPEGRPAVDVAAEANRRLENLDEIFPPGQGSVVFKEAGFATVVKDLREQFVGDVRQALWVLMGTVGFVLLIACANIANLFLVRADGRENETAIRAALGAGRGSILTGSLLEGAGLGLVAGAVGWLLAQAGMWALLRLGPQNLPRLDELTIDARVLGFTLALSLLAGLSFGSIPTVRHGSRRLAAALKEGGRGSTASRSRHRARSVLVVSQVALALVLLVGSGLMLRSFSLLSGIDPGFEAGGVVKFDVALSATSYPGDAAPAAFLQRVLDDLRGLPGVESVGGINALPLDGGSSGGGVLVEDHPEDPGDMPKLHLFKYATPGYFETLRIPLIAGRTFERADHEQRSGAVIVNEAFARRYWPDGDAVGKSLQPRWSGRPDTAHWQTIVGVVGGVHDLRLEDEPPEIIYYPLLGNHPGFGTWEVRNLSFVVRAPGDVSLLAEPIRRIVRDLDPGLPIANMIAVEQLVSDARAQTAFTMTLLVTGAVGALLIGAVGIYGVISYIVSRQTREIGVRLALGARPQEISLMVVRRTLFTVLVGIVAGLVGAVALTRFMRALLFGVSPLDPVTFAAVVVMLTVVAVLASWLPARRAASIDPLAALRGE